MTRYELACDKRITIAAVISEILMIITFALLVNAIASEIFNLHIFFAESISVKTGLIAFVVLQYIILALELIARNREDRRGFTLPIMYIPGGIIVRFFLITTLTVLVVLAKLIVYFISVLFSFMTQIFRLDKVVNTASLVDDVDHYTERGEIMVNKLYNLLYFHKIHANSSVFTSMFNNSLSFWCINH